MEDGRTRRLEVHRAIGIERNGGRVDPSPTGCRCGRAACVGLSGEWNRGDPTVESDRSRELYQSDIVGCGRSIEVRVGDEASHSTGLFATFDDGNVMVTEYDRDVRGERSVFVSEAVSRGKNPIVRDERSTTEVVFSGYRDGEARLPRVLACRGLRTANNSLLRFAYRLFLEAACTSRKRCDGEGEKRDCVFLVQCHVRKYLRCE